MRRTYYSIIFIILLLITLSSSAQNGFTRKQHLTTASENTDTICLKLTRSGRIVCFAKSSGGAIGSDTATWYLLTDTLRPKSDIVRIDNLSGQGNYTFKSDSIFNASNQPFIIAGQQIQRFEIEGIDQRDSMYYSAGVRKLPPAFGPSQPFRSSLEKINPYNFSGASVAIQKNNILIENRGQGGARINAMEYTTDGIMKHEGNGLILDIPTSKKGHVLTDIDGNGAAEWHEGFWKIESGSYQPTKQGGFDFIDTIGAVIYRLYIDTQLVAGTAFPSVKCQAYDTNSGFLCTSGIEYNAFTGELQGVLAALDTSTFTGTLVKTSPTEAILVEMQGGGSTNGFEAKNGGVRMYSNATAGISAHEIILSKLDTSFIIDIPSQGAGKFIGDVDGNGAAEWLPVGVAFTPIDSVDSSFDAGTITYDSNYQYIKVEDTNTGSKHLWRRYLLGW